ncbi:MAG: DUF502 domain-containing protein [bacterium]|nr:DUF502 domain-containing protein [bacterium]
MKKIQAAFWAGLITVIGFVIPLYILYQVWGLVIWISKVVGVIFFSNPILNTLVYALTLTALVCLVGWAFKFKFFRICFEWIKAKIPIVSTILKFIPSNEELELLTSDKVEEVMVQIYPGSGIWVAGLLTNEEALKIFGGKKFVTIWIPHGPIWLTGSMFKVERDVAEIKFTGARASDFLVAVSTCGARSSSHGHKTK